MQKYQINIQKIGGIVALINVVVVVVTLVVALGFIGAAALADPNKLVELAIRNPSLLIIQDVLKFFSAGVAVILIVVLHNRFANYYAGLMRVATLFGTLSVLCLIINAGLSMFIVTKTANLSQEQSWMGNAMHALVSQQRILTFFVQGYLHGVINLLGMAVIFFNGFWYLLVSWVSLKTHSFPKWHSYLGLTMGGLSLLPPLGIIVLLLGIPWSVGLGRILLEK